MRRRWSLVEIQLCEVLERHPTGQISLDNLAAELDRDRRVVSSAVARLRRRGRLQVVPGRGRVPNTYQLADS